MKSGLVCKTGLRTNSDNLTDVYTGRLQKLYTYGIYIPLTVKKRASRQFIINNLAQMYILSMCGYKR